MLRHKPSSKKAFTLLELIVVIVILAILAAIAIPTFARVIDRTKDETAGITLASVARNAQALNGFSKGNSFTALTVDKAVEETVGKVSASAGTFATSEPFELAPNSLTVTPGATGTASVKYAQVGLALSEQSDVMALSMRSTTGRCVWVKAEATSGTIWKVSKDKLTTCDSTFGLTLTGASGEAVDPTSPDGGEIPDEGETPGAGGSDGDSEVLPPGLMDPNDPDSLPITGVYCTDNNCADHSVLNASAMEVSRLGSESRFLGLAIDADHQQMIGTRADGIYFVDLETGNTRKVYNASNLSDIVYFRGGYLFANDKAHFQKFRVTASGVTLVDDKLAELTQHVTGTTSSFETSAWYSKTFTGDVVGGGAQLYFVTGNGMPVTGEFDPKEGASLTSIAKIDINGKFAPQPVAYLNPALNNALGVCAISVDANYLYVQASSAKNGEVVADGQRSGIWRLDKSASNVNLDEVEPWVERPVGCDTYSGTSEITALGPKLFMSDGDSSIISIDKNTGEEKLMAGEGYSNTPGGQLGVGREASFELSLEYVSAMAAYKDKIYLSSGYQGSSIYAMKAATPLRNDIESRPLSIAAGATPVRIASISDPSFSMAFNPKNNGLYISKQRASEGSGSYTVTPQGEVTAHVGYDAIAGTPFVFGDRILNQFHSSWVNSTARETWSPRPWGVDHCLNTTNRAAFTSRDANGVPWCLDSTGFTSYEITTRPKSHPVANMSTVFANKDTEIIRLSVTGTSVYVVTVTPRALGAGEDEIAIRTLHIDLSQANPSPMVVDTFITGISDVVWSSASIAVSATDIFLPTNTGVVKIAKSGGHTLLVPWVSEVAMMGVVHNGTSLFFMTHEGDVYRVD